MYIRNASEKPLALSELDCDGNALPTSGGSTIQVYFLVSCWERHSRKKIALSDVVHLPMRYIRLVPNGGRWADGTAERACYFLNLDFACALLRSMFR